MSHRSFATISLLLLFQAAAVAQKPIITTPVSVRSLQVQPGAGVTTLANVLICK